MIKVHNIQKYFNKNKPNEIHVLNNINLQFPKTGLVCLLGPSGSGKTTLLNVISGLDRVDSGEIDIVDKTIKHYSSDNWDLIRSRHFGYIFQNYYLLPNLTVAQNLEFVLKMMDLSVDEIDRRINYALDAVGMLKLKRRKPNQLSGGQQQRVAIARALVKSPDVVVADEPTGNLDEKNTLQIMNIIKKISKECLVILVTHERRLADFYGDEIIELLDGQVVNRFNISHNSDLISFDDHNIYLQEFNQDEVSTTDLNIKYFYQEKSVPLALNIIYKDHTFYIKSLSDNVKIKFLNNDSEIKVIDSKKPVFKNETLDTHDYNLEKIAKKTKINHSVIKFKDTFKMALAHLGGLRKRQKFLFLVLVLSTILVLSAFVNFYESIDRNEKNFMTTNRNLIQVTGFENYSISEIESLKTKFGEGNILGPAAYVNVSNITFDLFFQNQNKPQANFLPTHSMLPIDVVDNPKLVKGSLPIEDTDIVIDKWLVDLMLADNQYKALGASDPEQFIGLKYHHSYLSFYGKIVGIVDTNNPNVYTTRTNYQLSIINSIEQNKFAVASQFQVNTYNNNIRPYYLVDDFVDEIKSRLTDEIVFAERKNADTLTLAPNEIVISKALFEVDYMKNPNFYNNYKLRNHQDYTVVGVIDDGGHNLIVHPSALETLMFAGLKIIEEMSIYSTNFPKTLSEIEELELNGQSFYLLERDYHYSKTFSWVRYSFSIIVLAASLVFLYFIMRSSLIARVYDVGVYRALGVKKANIFRMFTTEIIIITTFTSIIGIVFVSWFIIEVNNFAKFEVIRYRAFLPALALAFILGCNLAVGLIPVYNLLRSTPAQILSKYDI